MASSSSYWCHSCQLQITPITEEVICPNCQGGFVEKLEENQESNDTPVETPSGSNTDFTTLPFDLGVFFPGNESVANVFSWNVSNNRSTPSTSRSEPASSSGAPYNLRQRPNRTGSLGATRRRVPEQELIQDVVRRVFGNVDPPFIEFSLGGGGNFPAFNFMELHGNTGDYAWGPNGLDNIISQLLGQLENAGPPPASPDAIKNLPTITISQEQVDQGQDCSVCMDTFKLNEAAKKLPCSHCFHVPCIDPWLELHNTCPICRKIVDESSCGSSSDGRGASSSGQTSGSDPNQSSQQENNLFSFFSNVFNRNPNNEDQS